MGLRGEPLLVQQFVRGGADRIGMSAKIEADTMKAKNL
jgi:hypothetical protein